MSDPIIKVETHEGRPMVSSLEVAERFKKEHKNVLRSMHASEMSAEFSALNFEPASYVDAQGKPRPMFWMTRDGFWALAMTFTGKEAAALREKIILRLNQAEEIIRGAVTELDPVILAEMQLAAAKRVAAERDKAIEEAAVLRGQQKLLTQERTQSLAERDHLLRSLGETKKDLLAVAKHAYKVMHGVEERMVALEKAAPDLFSNLGNVITLPTSKE